MIIIALQKFHDKFEKQDITKIKKEEMGILLFETFSGM